MVNTLKLRAALIERGLTNDDIAQKIGISKQSFSMKANNKRGFKISEVYKIVNLLKIAEHEIVSIFFAPCVEFNSTRAKNND